MLFLFDLIEREQYIKQNAEKPCVLCDDAGVTLQGDECVCVGKEG